MDGFLEVVAGYELHAGESCIYNRDFFNKYINQDIAYSLLQVSHTYSYIIDLLNQKHDELNPDTMKKLNEELKSIDERIKAIREKQIALLNNKLDNNKLRKEIYQIGETDLSKIKEIKMLDIKIDSELAENDSQLEIALILRKSKSAEVFKSDEKMKALDVEIERLIGFLNTLLNELNGKNIDIFNGLDIDSLKEQYEQVLVSIVQNTSARKAYVSYLFDILKKESKMLPEIYETAKYFVSNAKKENDFYVPELLTKNNQIELNRRITNEASHTLDDFVDIFCRNSTDNDKVITTIGNSYLNMQPFIDGIYAYVTNLPLYSQNPSKEKADYNVLLDFYSKVQIESGKLSLKDSRSILNIPNKFSRKKHFYASLEREPYEFATRVFDSFSDGCTYMEIHNFDSKISNEQQNNSAPQINNTPTLQSGDNFEINEFGEIVRKNPNFAGGSTNFDEENTTGKTL